MKRALVSALLVPLALAQFSQHTITLAEALPVLQEISSRPAGLSARPTESEWRKWTDEQTAAVEARLNQGEADSLAYFLLFGTSFTKQPPIVLSQLAGAARSGLLRARVDDLVAAIRKPGGNARLVFVREFLARRRIQPDSQDGAVGVFLYDNLQRVLRENIDYAARAQDQSAYSTRGISLDTGIYANFGIHRALESLRASGVLKPSSVRRAAVIGPGLDFVDKDSGFDYYPEQTTQPFALLESLTQLGLSSSETALTVFDISPRTLRHIQQARNRPYRIQLARSESQSWTPALTGYWQSFGSRSARAVTPLPAPDTVGKLETRAVEFDASFTRAITPVAWNAVLERPTPSNAARFDLIIATNVFVYYTPFEQALALANIAILLRPGGIFVSNDALPLAASLPLAALPSVRTEYSTLLGDTFTIYQKNEK